MRLDDLRNLAVIDPATACLLGTVTGYWVDGAAGRVAALAIRPVDVALAQRVSSDRVARVGRDAVILTLADGAMAPVVAPVADSWLDRRHISGLVVYTDVGECLGRVAGANIDPETLTIESYDLAVP
jgi:sporulation protein YlmC with PRC-barrel domain